MFKSCLVLLIAMIFLLVPQWTEAAITTGGKRDNLSIKRYLQKTRENMVGKIIVILGQMYQIQNRNTEISFLTYTK